MKTSVIWGTGQGGIMVRNLLQADTELVAFCDNNKSLWGASLDGISVVPPERLSDINPDCIYISILIRDASNSVKEQIENLGVYCDIINITDLRDRYDVRLATLRAISKEIDKRNINGAVAELGVYRGSFAAEINRMFPDRKIYLFDTFEGFHQRDIDIERTNRYSNSQEAKFKDTSKEIVRGLLPHPDQAIFRKGYFPDTASGLMEEFALVSLDADLYQPTYEGLKFFYPSMSRGGYIILHDYNNSQFSGAGEAIDRFCRENKIFLTPLCDLHGSAVIVKSN